MCGIVGEYQYNNQFQGCENIQMMLNTIKSRGPDFSGYSVNHPISLGHSRLSIIDLSSASNQPFIDDEAKLEMVYNGCIYNYKELRKALIKAGHIFKTSSDTEVVMKSYIEWGNNCLKKFEVVLDPHTAIGYGAFDKHNLKGNNIVLATAHPCKFPDAIQSSINVKAELPNELIFILDQKENYDIVENDIEKVKQHIKDRI